jgi:hypothetical protein
LHQEEEEREYRHEEPEHVHEVATHVDHIAENQQYHGREVEDDDFETFVQLDAFAQKKQGDHHQPHPESLNEIKKINKSLAKIVSTAHLYVKGVGQELPVVRPSPKEIQKERDQKEDSQEPEALDANGLSDNQEVCRKDERDGSEDQAIQSSHADQCKYHSAIRHMPRLGDSEDEEERTQENQKREKRGFQAAGGPGSISPAAGQKKRSQIVEEILLRIELSVKPEQKKDRGKTEQDSQDLGHCNGIQPHLHEQTQKQGPEKVRVSLHLLAKVVDQAMSVGEILGISEGDEGIVTDEAQVINVKQ